MRKIHVISLGENPPTLEDFRQSISCALGARSLLFTLPLAQLYEGPFRVVSKEEKVYHVQRGPRSEVISVDRLKAYVGRDEPEVAVPPARGRPKKPPDD